MGIACCCNCICKSSWSFNPSQIKAWAGPSHWFFDPSKGLRLDLSEKSPYSHHRSGVEPWQIQIQIQIHWSIVFPPYHICMWCLQAQIQNCTPELYLSAAIFVRKVALLLLSLVVIRSDKWCTIKSIVSNLQQQQLQTFQQNMWGLFLSEIELCNWLNSSRLIVSCYLLLWTLEEVHFSSRAFAFWWILSCTWPPWPGWLFRLFATRAALAMPQMTNERTGPVSTYNK